ncbi:alanine dehydrogenase/PNT, N-terminal domain protein, partial [Vibrio parahaemolyticus VP2007-007]
VYFLAAYLVLSLLKSLSLVVVSLVQTQLVWLLAFAQT